MAHFKVFPVDKLLKFHMGLLNSASGMAGERAKSDSDVIGCILHLQIFKIASWNEWTMDGIGC